MRSGRPTRDGESFMKLGSYEAFGVQTGLFALDGGAMFGTVPKVLWSKTNPADELNRIDMEARALLLKSDKYCILVDVGLGENLKEKYGEKFALKFADMYKFDQSKNSLSKNLKKLGLGPNDITHVILTHLHFDHAGGATDFQNGKLVPTFPKAKYFVQRKNLATAQNPNAREKASYLKENFEPLVSAGVLELLDGDVENLLPEVSVFSTFGHTEAQQLVKVGNFDLVYGGDIIPTSSHIRGPFVMGYDLHPLVIMEEKKKILSQVAEHKGMVFFEHDPFMVAARVELHGNDFQVSEKVQF